MYWEALAVTALLSGVILAFQYKNDLIEPHGLSKTRAARLEGKGASSANLKSQRSAGFKLLRRQYVLGFTIMSLADWIQGPFLLPMYASFGLSNSDVAALYSVDYLVGIVAGLLAGGLADAMGARKACILYGYLYALSCICNHFGNIFMPIVVLGCALDGLCNALLRTSFETWISIACSQRGYSSHWAVHAGAVANWFSTVMSLLAGVICHIVVALVSVGAEWVADGLVGDVPSLAYVATMDVAALLLVCGSVYITAHWDDARIQCDAPSAAASGVLSSLREAVLNLQTAAKCVFPHFYSTNAVIDTKSKQAKPVRSPRIPLRAIILLEVAFESTLMIFIGVFPMTVAAVDPVAGSTMMGVLFVSLMGSILVGSSLANGAISSKMSVSLGWRVMCTISVMATAFIWYAHFAIEHIDLQSAFSETVIHSHIRGLVFGSLCVLEVCFGFYYPYLALMHSAYASDGLRNSCVAIVRSLSYAIALTALFALWLTGSLFACWSVMLLTSIVALLCSLNISEGVVVL